MTFEYLLSTYHFDEIVDVLYMKKEVIAFVVRWQDSRGELWLWKS